MCVHDEESEAYRLVMSELNRLREEKGLEPVNDCIDPYDRYVVAYMCYYVFDGSIEEAEKFAKDIYDYFGDDGDENLYVSIN